ncbi:MAG: asparagine synthase (glutamine-hydrolyzing) [Burkholderiaceae bacterium]|nr:asparagine synthase (glutamine-hydrolyzing) [Burkholderiaceae bacterium]
MCGITGFLGFPAKAMAGKVLRSMTAAIAHRGPDDEGYWLDEESEVALGHQRLSIVDLSSNGHQPMTSVDGRYVIVFNGEVYNFKDVRAEIEATGSAPAWRGHSDTEVMLAAISAWGVERALQRFTGMFALALWDRTERRLFLARDRLGEKPLYYGWSGDTFFFASELKALRRWPGWQPEIDRGSIALLMRYGYVPTPYSIYRRVFKLSPGAFVTVNLGDARRGPAADPRAPLPVRHYWSLRDTVRLSTDQRFAGNEREAADQLDQLLRASIRRQMIADVPLGAFLSGGVDSSTVVALMQAQSNASIRTFTIGFNEGAYDEAVYAKAVAKHLGTDHTELYVTASEAMSVIPKLPDLYDEPFADSSQIPTHLVSRIARADVTVSLSGDAGDELFGGYDRYFVGRRIWRRIGWIPRGLRRSAARLLTALSPDQWERIFARVGPYLPRAARQPNPGDKIHKLAEILDATGSQDFYRGLISHWRNPSGLVLGSHEPQTILELPDQWPKLDDFVERMMFLDSVSYLPDDILVKVDRAAMGVGLETRVPLLDHSIVEFAWRLPPALKVRDGTGKWLLRQVLYRYVPRELIERPKMGFGVPIDSWLRGPLVEWAESLLNEGRLRREGFFDVSEISRKWCEHRDGVRNWHYYLWDVLMFQAWLDNHQGVSGR